MFPASSVRLTRTLQQQRHIVIPNDISYFHKIEISSANLHLAEEIEGAFVLTASWLLLATLGARQPLLGYLVALLPANVLQRRSKVI